MENKLIRATAKDGMVKIIAAETTNLVRDAISVHKTSATAGTALGRMITAAALMGSNIKNHKETLTVKINGGGPIGNVTAIAYPGGSVKGYVGNPKAELEVNSKGRLDVGKAIGKNGNLVVIRDLGLKDPYIGQVPIYTGEIGDDLAYYYTVSEQTPSAVGLGVLIDKDLSCKVSGGYIIQMMPGADEMLADIITYRIEEMPSITEYLRAGKRMEDILNYLFDDMGLNILEETSIRYQCNCSKDRVTKALISIGMEELLAISKDNKDEIVKCHYCNAEYKYTPGDIRELINNIKS